jgi:hypothetical protein
MAPIIKIMKRSITVSKLPRRNGELVITKKYFHSKVDLHKVETIWLVLKY